MQELILTISRVEMVTRTSDVSTHGSTLRLTVPPGSSHPTQEQFLTAWCRAQLGSLIPDRLRRWETEIGLAVNEVRMKKMKTKCGSCNIEACRIWFNSELVTKLERSIEYILVYELTHLLERHHTHRFRCLMDHFLPAPAYSPR
ncbi:MAG: YgjP-like metallopeptidase domain-containing protein [Alkalispirochaeta sp.]